MDMTRRILLLSAAFLVSMLTGCAGHPSLPQPSGPLRAMNPGLWNYHGNDVLPQASSRSAGS